MDFVRLNGDSGVITIVFAGLVILVLAVGVVLYVAFPMRGRAVPHAPWLSAILIAPVVFIGHLLPRVEPDDLSLVEPDDTGDPDRLLR